jgi:DNA repair exonuclease SbcCD ATPase subunit
MKLKKISWKNFKSYSNAMTELVFNNSPSLNLIVGSNGTGKSSIADCIIYALYGKIDGTNNSDIPNRINKNFYVKIELNCNGHEIIVERGIAPSLFIVTIDGVVVDTAGKNNVQAMLEENYYKIPYSVFKNTLILSINDFKSLVDLNPSDKRNIIDKIFGFTEYNLMMKLIKEDIKMLDNSINSNDGSLKTASINIEKYEQQLLELKSNEVSQEEIDELTEKINEVKKLKATNEENIKKLDEVRKKLDRQTTEKNMDIRDLKRKIEENKTKIRLIDLKKCPTCGSSLDTDEFHKERESLVRENESLEATILEISSVITDISNKMRAVDSKRSVFVDAINKSGLTDMVSDLKYKVSLRKNNYQPLLNLKDNLNIQISQLNEEKEFLLKRKMVYDCVMQILGDGGIKEYIANKYIPTINQIISEMLEFMGINYNIVFDKTFKATITSNGYNVSYNSLSTGEKKRIDFATVISFIKLLKLQLGDMNLLFLDEMLASIDINGVSDMVSILKDLSEELNMNIYLIHHAQVENVVFDNVFETSKPDGFSKISIIN